MTHGIEDVARTESPSLHEREHRTLDSDTVMRHLALSLDDLLLRLVPIRYAMPELQALLAQCF